jgi:hypothetical protein
MASTLSQQFTKRMNILVTPATHTRVRVAAASRNVDMGEIVSELVMAKLPSVKGEDEETD